MKINVIKGKALALSFIAFGAKVLIRIVVESVFLLL